MAKLELGLIQIFYGDGRGKTSAAIGTAIRAAGHGLNVAVIQFLKDGSISGEYNYLKKHKIKILQLGPSAGKKYDKMVKEGKARLIKEYFTYDRKIIENSKKGLTLAEKLISSGKYDLVVLDEVNTAAAFGHFSYDDIIRVLKKKHEKTEVIMTGFKPDERLIEMADLVSEVKKIKHPFDRGILARWGVDY
ncbi:MAG: cob(I)yrinic acid a,c-diamide adenosyltransferase [Candidatus Micrarchaeota archaeon]|nr:cob(I)yrinic acid a,c-diamide adenosyltransferase [Candidatus Micrarchaeota archaeon]